nr:MAG TPA: hypothetical protein [Caudoviricetes sp.]
MMYQFLIMTLPMLPPISFDILLQFREVLMHFLFELQQDFQHLLLRPQLPQ